MNATVPPVLKTALPKLTGARFIDAVQLYLVGPAANAQHISAL